MEEEKKKHLKLELEKDEERKRLIRMEKQKLINQSNPELTCPPLPKVVQS